MRHAPLALQSTGQRQTDNDLELDLDSSMVARTVAMSFASLRSPVNRPSPSSVPPSRTSASRREAGGTPDDSGADPRLVTGRLIEPVRRRAST
jgi:hypothetical protein